MRKKLSVFCLFATLFLFSVQVFAGDRVVDNAGLLGNAEIENLGKLTEQIASNYDFDLVIVTEESIGSSPMEYADDFFDYNGYGKGEDRDGCLFLLVSGSRDYWFSTSGRGIEILTSSAFGKLENDVLKFLADDNYADAYLSFVADWEEFLALDAMGRRYNFFHQWNAVLTSAAWIAALGIGFIIVGIWKSKMNTVFPQKGAAAYVVQDSLVFTEQKDVFLYSTVTKTKRQTESSSRGGSHIGSSGRRHGGGGGKY